MIQPQKPNTSNSEEPVTSTDETVPFYLKEQTSTMAGGCDDGRLPPRGGVTAIATGGSGDGPLKPGQNVMCKIVQQVNDGYMVHIPIYNMAGMLRTNSTYQPGQDVLAQYICRMEDKSICLLVDNLANRQQRQKKELKDGDFIICQIIDRTENGYNVILIDHKLEGFIQGSANYAPGANVFAQFVGILNNRPHCVFLKESTACKT